MNHHPKQKSDYSAANATQRRDCYNYSNEDIFLVALHNELRGEHARNCISMKGK